MTTTVIIPTKNEIDAIKQILPQVNLDWADEWILIDGNSTDGTVEEAEKLGFETSKKLNCQFLKVDQTDNKAVQEATDKTIMQMDKIDILVCSVLQCIPSMLLDP